ncbi:uncharacterized protein [Palaemon carinicauda]|uniref:uncharacterized protein n=1 Tax=Palaemon carinicauda TaxID=392227 RepID=UPI0035B5C393
MLQVTSIILINGHNDVPSLQSLSTSQTSPSTFQTSPSIHNIEDGLRAYPPPVVSDTSTSPLTSYPSRSSRSPYDSSPSSFSDTKPGRDVHAFTPLEVPLEVPRKSKRTRWKQVALFTWDSLSSGETSPISVSGAELSGDASFPHPSPTSEHEHRVKRSSPYYSFKESRRRGRAEGMYSLLLPDDRIQTVSYYADENGYFPSISYKGGHQTSYYIMYPPGSKKYPETLQKGTTVQNPKLQGHEQPPYHKTIDNGHYRGRGQDSGFVTQKKPANHYLHHRAQTSKDIPGRSYSNFPISEYQAPPITKGHRTQVSPALVQYHGTIRHSPKADERKSEFSVKRIPFIAEQKYNSPANSYQQSDGRSRKYSTGRSAMKNAPSYAQKTYITARPNVLPSQFGHKLKELYGPAASREIVRVPPNPNGIEITKLTAHDLTSLYSPPTQTEYEKTISSKHFVHASSPETKGLPHTATHPVGEAMLELHDQGYLMENRMLDGDNLSVDIASDDNPDPKFSEDLFMTPDLMALINFDVMKTLFRPPNIFTDQPFFRPRSLRRIVRRISLIS